ncbi:MAG: hypothetical protein R2845_06860 [Thermomicrobiales bacterium]
MTDRDPYGRRRIPDDRDYQNPDWEDEGAAPDPYDYQPPQDPRRAMPPAGRQPAGAEDPFLPANDPYASSSYRQPQLLHTMRRNAVNGASSPPGPIAHTRPEARSDSLNRPRIRMRRSDVSSVHPHTTTRNIPKPMT